jgi:hypothetical protein
MMRAKQKQKKATAIRLSSSFYSVAKGEKAGADLWHTITHWKYGGVSPGRAGADIQRATIEAWAKAGLVLVKTRKPDIAAGEHHLARPIVSVNLTREGARRVRARESRELARTSAAA